MAAIGLDRFSGDKGDKRMSPKMSPKMSPFFGGGQRGQARGQRRMSPLPTLISRPEGSGDMTGERQGNLGDHGAGEFAFRRARPRFFPFKGVGMVTLISLGTFDAAAKRESCI